MKDQIENIRKQKARYYRRHRERLLAKDHETYRQNPLKRKAQRLRKDYGISLEDYNRMLDAQGHRCAVCRRPERRIVYGKVKALAVDHDHKTGAIRGLLCQTCNSALGYLDDDLLLIRALVSYRESFLGG